MHEPDHDFRDEQYPDGPLGDNAFTVDIDSELHAAIDAASAELRADAMRTRRTQRLVAREESTLVGVLITLAEKRARVAMRTSAGWECHGTLTAVGADVAVLVDDQFRRYAVRLDHVSSVTPERGSVPFGGSVTGDGTGSETLSFDGLLRELHAIDAEMHVVLEGDEQAGVASWVGVDVACIVAESRGGHGAAPVERRLDSSGVGGPQRSNGVGLSHGVAVATYVRLESIVAVVTP